MELEKVDLKNFLSQLDENNEEAVKLLIEELNPYLYSYCSSTFGIENTNMYFEDMKQVAYETVIEVTSKFKGTDIKSFYKYIHSCINHKLINEFTREIKAIEENVSLYEPLKNGVYVKDIIIKNAGFEDFVVNKLQKCDLENYVLSKLNKNQRKLFKDILDPNYELKCYARRKNVSVDSVRRRIKRLKHRIFKILKDVKNTLN